MDCPLEGLELGEELYWEPMRVVPPGPWAGHIASAFWLVKVARPTGLVELGTHSGNSYFAFCQAVAALELSTRCFAVDTWKGDEHAGHYGEYVYQEILRFNDVHFSRFSTLLRTTFDDARPYFADGTIDLLHIDGLHSYDAVRHDFENWRTALSPRGIVLLHDINVRERDFGVWRLWAELSEQFPSFAFDHSHGLGVVGVGPEQPPALARLFALRHEEEAAAMLRRRFAARGESFRRRVDLRVLEGQVGSLNAAIELHARELAERNQEIDRLGQQLAAQESWNADLLAARDRLIDAQRDMLQSAEGALQARDAVIVARDRIIEARDLAMREAAEIHATHAREWSAGNDDTRRRTSEVEGLRQEIAQLADERARLAAAHLAACRDRDRLKKKYRRKRRGVAAATMQWLGKLLRRPVGKAKSAQPGSPAAHTSATPDVVPETVPPTPAPPASEAGLVSPLDTRAALRGILASRLDAFLASGARLEFPQHAHPEVSIVLVLHNQAELTFGCLTSILESHVASEALPIEVVIVDNASHDATGTLLGRVDGAQILRPGENLHFLLGVNHAARHVRGRCILLLNNDAQLLPGAVEAAWRTLSGEPSIGAVGGRIILSDGTLQEAGSVIWNDGTCVGYGRGRSPNDPEFMFRRDVDYCSGAFLLTPTALFRQLGGFDERYAPAYYEETDYCVRLWKTGRRVVFEPDAAIMHLEFGSAASGSDAAFELQRRNWRRFATVHADWLQGQMPPSPLNELRARQARPARAAKRVLMLEDRVPKTALGSGYPRARDLLHELVAAGVDVTFYPMYRHHEVWPEVRATVGPTVETFILGSADQLGPFLASRRGHYDALLVCRFHNMRRLVELEAEDPTLLGDAYVVYDAEAVFARRDVLREKTNGREMTPDEAAGLVADEVALTRLADTVLSVSDGERRLFEDHGVASVVKLGHAVDVAPTPAPFASRDRLLFLGAVHDDNSPNADSLLWFADAILPRLREQLGQQNLRLTVVGLNRSAMVAARGGKEFDFVGHVEDLAACFDQARLVVVPTRFAAGMPHKVHQSAALGVPIVATRLIADQVGWEDGRELLVADDAAEFATACARLFTDEALWRQVRRGALERCRRECSRADFQRTVRAVIASVPEGGTLGHVHPATPARSVPATAYVGRSDACDYSAAVPFGYVPSPTAQPASVAVLCHLFHGELADEFRYYLGNIPGRTDLFLSTDTEAKRAVLAQVFGEWTGKVEVRLVPNRGRDIAPKLVGFKDVHDRYPLVLHLHSKMSAHDEVLAPWRTFLLENLLGSPAIVRSIFDVFARLPRIGMVYPQYYEYIRHWLDWGGNYPMAAQLAERMGTSVRADAALDFPTGSMFWARSAALRPLLDLGLTFEDFPTETGQTDGTLAHAIERLFLHGCEHAGYGWLKVANPALYFRTDTVIPIRSAEDLERYVARHCFTLTGPTAPPPAAEAPLVRPAVPPGLLAAVRARRPAPVREAA